jgi:hypothetical protein
MSARATNRRSCSHTTIREQGVGEKGRGALGGSQRWLPSIRGCGFLRRQRLSIKAVRGLTFVFGIDPVGSLLLLVLNRCRGTLTIEWQNLELPSDGN